MNPIEDWLTRPDGLADRLRALRAQAGLSGKELAEVMSWHPSKVSRLENGRQMPSPADLSAWAAGTRADAEATQGLMQMLGEVQALHQDWRRRMRRGQEAVQASYNDLVQRSQVIRHFETAYVPGLLQTPEYAKRVLTEMISLHDLDIDDVDAAVAMRMQRQRFVYDTSKRFEFLLAEPVLGWLLVPPASMRAQLDRLQTVIGLPNVRFGIIPLSHYPTPATPQNSMQMYDDLAVVETFTGETWLDEDAAAKCVKSFGLLWDEAVTGDDARRLIVVAAEALS
jgi:transcriptional regulator with XRE-family HTH domain